MKWLCRMLQPRIAGKHELGFTAECKVCGLKAWGATPDEARAELRRVHG